MVTIVRQINLKNIIKSPYPLVIGYFGCIHVMHGLLLNKYQRFNVLTFNDFTPKMKNQLYPFEERIELLKKLKPSIIYVFDIAKNNMTAKEFMDKVLSKIQPSNILVGNDFKFGKDHQSYKVLMENFPVQTVNYNPNVSTTKIAKLMKNKQIEKANSLLFSPYYYKSKWIGGDKQGKDLGFPTINLLVDRDIFLSEGSYITRTTLGNKTYESITFIGKSKTFKQKEFTLETHIIGKRILPRCLHIQSVRNNVKIEFLKYIRSITSYSSRKKLADAINRDLKKAKDYFERNK